MRKKLFILSSVFLPILMVLNGTQVWADGPTDAAGQFGFDLAAGTFSDYGFWGGGARYFLTNWLDLHVTAGADTTGTLVGVGPRFYYSPDANRCFFFIPCTPRLFIGGTYLHSGGGTVSVSDDGLSGTYKEGTGAATNISIGTYDTFMDHLTLGLEIGYRFWNQRPTATPQSGDQSYQLLSDARSWSEDNFSAAITLGVLF